LGDFKGGRGFLVVRVNVKLRPKAYSVDSRFVVGRWVVPGIIKSLVAILAGGLLVGVWGCVIFEVTEPRNCQQDLQSTWIDFTKRLHEF
jgi:hypothetical protein